MQFDYTVFRVRWELMRWDILYYASMQINKITFFTIEAGQNQPGQQASIERALFIQ